MDGMWQGPLCASPEQDESGQLKFEPLYKRCLVDHIPPHLLLSYKNVSVVRKEIKFTFIDSHSILIIIIFTFIMIVDSLGASAWPHFASKMRGFGIVQARGRNKSFVLEWVMGTKIANMRSYIAINKLLGRYASVN
jgi:hypothetical protein